MIAMARHATDTSLERLTAIELAGHVPVVGARQVTQQPSIAPYLDCVRVVGVGWLTPQFQPVARAQLLPHLLRLVVCQPGSQ